MGKGGGGEGKKFGDPGKSKRRTIRVKAGNLKLGEGNWFIREEVGIRFRQDRRKHRKQKRGCQELGKDKFQEDPDSQSSEELEENVTLKEIVLEVQGKTN